MLIVEKYNPKYFTSIFKKNILSYIVFVSFEMFRSYRTFQISFRSVNNGVRSTSVIRWFSDQPKNPTTPPPNSKHPKISESLFSNDFDTQKIPLVGRLKNPIVAKLWAAREEAIQRMSKTAEEQHTTTHDEKPTTTTTSSTSRIASKAPKDSATGIGYPFSTDPFLLETYKVKKGNLAVEFNVLTPHFNTLIILYIYVSFAL